MTRPTDSHALSSISVTACRKSRMCWEALSCRPVFLESKIHPGSCISHRPVEFRFMFQHHRQVNYLWISKILCHQIAQLRIKRRPWQKNRAVLKRKGWLCKETRSSYPSISEGPSSEKATCIFVDPKLFWQIESSLKGDFQRMPLLLPLHGISMGSKACTVRTELGNVGNFAP